MTANTANRAIKARPKATPSRIQKNIQNAKAIIDKQIVDNAILHIAETEELSVADLPAGEISVPLNIWLDNKAEIRTRSSKIAVQIAADENPDDLVGDLDSITMIILPFVTQLDGRSYSHAQKLRNRYHYKGEIRAIGYVKQDQLGFLARVGCNAFELDDGENYDDAMQAFTTFSDVYQPSADGGRLIFSRRRAIH